MSSLSSALVRVVELYKELVQPPTERKRRIGQVWDNSQSASCLACLRQCAETIILLPRWAWFEFWGCRRNLVRVRVKVRVRVRVRGGD